MFQENMFTCDVLGNKVSKYAEANVWSVAYSVWVFVVSYLVINWYLLGTNNVVNG